jgi:hypothetical protein
MQQVYEGVVAHGIVQLPPEAQLPDGTRVQIVPITTLNEKQARRKAARWLAMKVGHLLMPMNGEFIEQTERPIWRFTIWLSSPWQAPRGPIGTLDVDAVDGTILAQPDIRKEFIRNAEQLERATL